MDMDLRALRAFTEVVEHGGFSQAARAGATTQPTLSKAVKQLEEELGGALLLRTRRGVRPTEMGQIVLRHARALLVGRENLRAELDAFRGLTGGRLRLGLAPFGAAVLFAPLVAEFRRRFPKVLIELREAGGRSLQQALRDGEIDFAVSLQPIPESFNWLGVHEDPVLALLPAGHALCGRKTLRLRDLADCPFILFESGFALNDIIADACRRSGFVAQEAARSGQADFIIALVASGLGVGLLPKLMVDLQKQLSVETIPIDEAELRWEAGLIWQRAVTLPPAAAQWLALVKEKMRKHERDEAM
jgi:DNA-binding transcriptional LysR family regulator